MNYYSLKSCEELINKYVNKYDFQVDQINEGVLGLRTIVLHSAPGDLKSIVIREVCLNSNSCGHTIKMYNKLPKKYQQIIDNVRNVDENLPKPQTQ